MFLQQKPQYETYIAASRHARKVLEASHNGISISVDTNPKLKRQADEPIFIRDSMRTDDIQGTTAKYVKELLKPPR